MERPLHPVPRFRNELLVLARALLYAEQTPTAHIELFRAALQPVPAMRRMQALARRTLAWTAVRPQPRAKALVARLRGDAVLGALLERHTLLMLPLPVVPRMRRWPGTERVPALETTHDLATWLRLDAGYLSWFADLSDRNRVRTSSALQHYTCQALPKADGGVRLLEAPKQHLKHIQRQILREILDQVAAHPAAHGFCRGRSTVTFAAPHAGRELVLRLDLKDFFPSISGPRVQALFRTLGYPETVADLLGGLCTTTTPRSILKAAGEPPERAQREDARQLYGRSHLPQGGVCSPAIANLCARRMDQRLAALAGAAGARYTRYADDLAFSGDGPFVRCAGRFALRAAAIAAEEGFAVNHRKTRYMPRSVRQHLAGLTVNGGPNLPRNEVDRLKATLVNCVRQGPATQNLEQHANFAAHLAGRVAYVAMVNPQRGAKLAALLRQIDWKGTDAGVTGRI